MIQLIHDTSSTIGNANLVARRFLAVRLENGLSQQAFADALGISLRGEQNYERGMRKLPGEVLLALAKAFEVDPLWVLEGPEERPRHLAGAGLNRETLARSFKIVRHAFSAADKPIDDAQFPAVVAAVYEFCMSNASGAGAEALVDNIIGATK
jgi:transcriptional regulator with XRE-family HTH domain